MKSKMLVALAIGTLVSLAGCTGSDTSSSTDSTP